MNVTGRVFCVLAFLLPVRLPAQISLQGLFSSPNQQLVEDAVRNGVFVISQQYQLKDTVSNEYFGRGGRQEFNTMVSVGIKLKGGYVYSDKAEHPWKYDSDFERYRGRYMPVICKTEFRELEDSVLTENVDFLRTGSETLVPSRFYFKTDTRCFGDKGFVPDGTAGEKNGWCVWVLSSGDTIEATVADSVEYLIFRKTLEIVSDSTECYIDAPSTKKNVLTGLYVNPVRTDVGQITFKLVGIMDKKGDSWRINLPFRFEITTNRGFEQGDEGLTPIQNEEEGIPEENNVKRNRK